MQTHNQASSSTKRTEKTTSVFPENRLIKQTDVTQNTVEMMTQSMLLFLSNNRTFQWDKQIDLFGHNLPVSEERYLCSTGGDEYQ